MISREPAPMLEDKEKWSLLFHDWVAKCLSKDPRVRPTAQSLLQVKTQPQMYVCRNMQSSVCLVIIDSGAAF